jgi:hypothetical protein
MFCGELRLTSCKYSKARVARPFRLARTLRQLPRFIVIAAQPSTVRTVPPTSD